MPQQKPPADLFDTGPPADLFHQDEPAAKKDTTFMDSVTKGWNVATTPLSDYLTDSGGNKYFDPKAAANYYDTPSDTDWRIPFTGGATWKGLGAGMLEGAGNVVSGFTSPLNIATMGALKGASSLAETAPMAARGLGLIGRGLSAPVAAHGAYETLRPDATLGERAFGLTELAGGAAGMAHTPPIRKPRIKPTVEPTLGDFSPDDIASLNREFDRVRGKTEPEVPHNQPETKPTISNDTKSTPEKRVADLYQSEFERLNPKTKFPGQSFEQKMARFEELTDKGTNGDITPAEIAEGQALNKELRDSGFDKETHDKLFPPEKELPPPEQGGLPPKGFDRRKSVTDYEKLLDEGVKQSNKPPPDTANDMSTLESEIPPEMQESFQTEGGTEGSPNASGESAASAEAMKRMEDMGKRGEQYVVYDRAGNKRVLIGPEAVDYVPQKGETYGIETQRGTRILTDNGGNVPGRKFGATRKEYPGFKGTQQPTTAQGGGAGGGNVGVSAPPPNVSPAGGTPPPSNIPPAATPPGSPPPLQPPPPIPPNTPPAARQGLVRRALAFNKELLTSWDLSAPGRQGKAFMLNKEWWTSLDDMIKAWGSPNAARQIQDSIQNHPSGYFTRQLSPAGVPIEGTSFAERMGLHLPPSEEVFNSQTGRVIRKYTGIEKSSRAHTAFLNKLRTDVFANFMDDAQAAGRNPTQNQPLAESFAKFINDATGRGSLDVGSWKLERSANVLNDTFFAPRNLSGQIRTWNAILNPYRYYTADPILRKQALKSLFAVAGAGLAVGELARMGGAQVSNDPTSADFRKIKIGDTRIDLFGGYQQFPVAAAKLALGQSTSTTTGKTTDLAGLRYGQQTRASVAERFFVNRLAPLPSFVWSWMNNREFDGKPFEVKRALFERTFPIAMKDIIDMANEDPKLAAMLAIPTTLGVTGTQTYTGR